MIYIDTSFIKLLFKLTSQNEWDEDIFKQIKSSKVWSAIMIHDKMLNRGNPEEHWERKLHDVVMDEEEQLYGFAPLRNPMCRQKICDYIYEIETNGVELSKKWKSDLSEYMDVSQMPDDFMVVFYGGGTDGGFTLDDHVTYINLLSMADELVKVEDVIKHEYFHIRKQSPIDDINDSDGYVFSKNNFARELLSYMLEEGVATFIQFGGLQKKYESSLFLTEKEFNRLQDYEIEFDRTLWLMDNSDNPTEAFWEGTKGSIMMFYIVGYDLAKTVYKHFGKDGLGLFVKNSDIDSFMHLFFEAKKTVYGERLKKYLIKQATKTKNQHAPF